MSVILNHSMLLSVQLILMKLGESVPLHNLHLHRLVVWLLGLTSLPPVEQRLSHRIYIFLVYSVLVQEKIRHVLIWSCPKLLLQTRILPWQVRILRVLNTWSGAHIWSYHGGLKLPSRALQLCYILAAKRTPLVNVWILLSLVVLAPVKPVLEALQMELMSFQ